MTFSTDILIEPTRHKFTCKLYSVATLRKVQYLIRIQIKEENVLSEEGLNSN